MTTYCIVGGVAGGASCAARLRRLDEQAEIILFERGDHVSFANCGLPYHIGGQITEREALLVQTPESLRKRARIDVRIRTEVQSIDPAARTITVQAREADQPETIAYDKLVLAPGAAPVRPPIPGIASERIKTLRNIPDMDAIKQRIDAGQAQRVAVIGGGYIGLEMAEALRDRKCAVTLIELAPQVMGPADPELTAVLHQELTLNGVDVRLQTAVSAFHDDKTALRLSLSDASELIVDLVVLAIGVAPETSLAKTAGLRLGERGGIAVNAHMQTSNEHIYAVGDAVEVTDLISQTTALIPLAGPANRQGRIAADHIYGRDSSYQATQGTAVCKVFGQSIAMTGLSEKQALRSGRNYAKVYVHPLDHAEYYPGASRMLLKLLFDPADGRVLGAQAVGAAGVDKRIDVIAMAVRAGLTVHDLAAAELAYAPPYGSAKDPVNYAGFVAENIINGDVIPVMPEDVPEWSGARLFVGTEEEQRAADFTGPLIPVDELRDRLTELDPTQEYLVACPAGLRGYLACRILGQAGFHCRNLIGGTKVLGLFADNPSRFRRTPAGAPVATTPASNPPPIGITPMHDIDARGMQCPGPVLKLKAALDSMQVGESVAIIAGDPGFAADMPAWCASTGHELVDLAPHEGAYRAVIRKAAASSTAPAPCEVNAATKQEMTIVGFSGDWDRVMAAFIIANGAASMGLQPTLFFTFWGLNALRRDHAVPVKKTLIERLFAWMMPRGARKLALSKMHFAGMGRLMMDGIMKQKGVEDLPSLIAQAQAGGVRLVACAMSMDLMGIKQEELIDGVEIGGVAAYLGTAINGRINLFI